MIIKTNTYEFKNFLLNMFVAVITLCNVNHILGEVKLINELLSAVVSLGTENDEEDVTMRLCGTSKTLCRLTVTGSASIGSLYVAEDAIIGGQLRVSELFVNGDANLNNLAVHGTSVHAGIVVTGEASIGRLTVGDMPFTDAFVQGGNSFGAPAFLGTNDAQPLHFETSGTQRMLISSTGAVSIVPPTSGVALTIGARANAIGLVVQGNGTARAATITAGNSTGGGLLIRGGPGAGVPLEVTASAGQGNAATFIGNNNAATAVTITPGINRVGLTIEDSGTSPGLRVFGSMQVNENNGFPLLVGGTQSAAATFDPASGQTNTFFVGAPRMIWAHVTADSLTVEQSGGITSVTHLGVGMYVITYETFGSTVPIVMVSTEPGFIAHASTPTSTGVMVTTSQIQSGDLELADASFNILIMGLVS